MDTCVLLRVPGSIAKILHYGTCKKNAGPILLSIPAHCDCFSICLFGLSAGFCISSHFDICSSGYVGCGAFKMQSRSRWQSAFILTGLLVAETVHSAPTSTQEAAASFKTQYPPSAANARLLLPETQGVSAYQPVGDVPTYVKQFYPTSLEREGRQLQKPTPDPREDPYSFAGGFEDLYDTLLGALIPNVLPTTSDAPATAPATIPVPSATLPSQETINGPPEATSTSTTAPTRISVPVPTGSSSASSLTSHSAKPQDTSTSVESISAANTIMATMANGQDVFLPVSTGPIPGTVKSRDDHPLPRASIVRLPQYMRLCIQLNLVR